MKLGLLYLFNLMELFGGSCGILPPIFGFCHWSNRRQRDRDLQVQKRKQTRNGHVAKCKHVVLFIFLQWRIIFMTLHELIGCTYKSAKQQ